MTPEIEITVSPAGISVHAEGVAYADVMFMAGGVLGDLADLVRDADKPNAVGPLHLNSTAGDGVTVVTTRPIVTTVPVAEEPVVDVPVTPKAEPKKTTTKPTATGTTACPQCDRTFTSNQARAVHLARTHGVRGKHADRRPEAPAPSKADLAATVHTALAEDDDKPTPKKTEPTRLPPGMPKTIGEERTVRCRKCGHMVRNGGELAHHDRAYHQPRDADTRPAPAGGTTEPAPEAPTSDDVAATVHEAAAKLEAALG